jgi:hypothetical protein
MFARIVAAAAALVFLPVLPAHADTPELPDRIVAAWRTDHVSVDERLQATMPATELARIRTAVRDAGFPVYVALVPETPYTRSSRYNLPTLLHARVGQPGLYLVELVSDDYWSDRGEVFRPGGLAGRDLVSVQLDDKQDNDLITSRPAPQVVRTIQQAGTAWDGRPLPPVAAGDLDPRRADDGPSVTDQEDRAAAIGGIAGGVLGFLLTLVIGLRRRKRKGTKPNKKLQQAAPLVDVPDFQLRADTKIEQAQRAVDRLDQRGKKTLDVLDRRDEAARRLDAARQLREDQPDDLLATIGALVLARQAEQAANATAVQPPCFFDPTHRPGTTKVEWDDAVEVPACPQCATVVRRHKTPSGLRVPKHSGLLGFGHELVPYWTLDPEDSPMVASGFGALTDDLADRVTGRKDDAR